jgi:DNA-binding transcriptional ArsR family regulator
VVENLPAPAVNSLDLGAVLSALADPLRRTIVIELLERPDAEYACASFDLGVAKSTRTHHWRVLREAGLIRQRDLGNGTTVQLRRADLRRRFPGLLEAVRTANARPRT